MLEASGREIDRLSGFLTPDETARAMQFVSLRRRNKFVMARGRMREILGRNIGISPEDVRFEYSENGKPSLCDIQPAPHFNLSHSGNLACLGICKNVRIGVDIEKRERLDTEQLEQYFSPAEQTALSNLEGKQREIAFYRCWTRKEAFLKATGEGLMRPLDSFEVSVVPDEPAMLRSLDGKTASARQWTLIDFTPGKAYTGCLAIAVANKGKNIRVTMRKLMDHYAAPRNGVH